MPPDVRTRLVLGVGALLGLLLALVGLLAPPETRPLTESDAVAVVNGTPIGRDEFERALEALEADRRSGDVTFDRERLLDRLIDEELLLQHALALDLPRTDPRVRSRLVRAVIDAVVAEADAAPADEVALRRFYDEHREYFAQPGRRRVRRYFVRGTDATARARAERIRVALESQEAGADLGDATVPVPDALLPIGNLNQYLGPTLTQAAARQSPGSVGVPIATSGGLHILYVVEAEGPTAPSFESIREVVESEHRRRAGEDALRRYLERLRDAAAIGRAEPE